MPNRTAAGRLQALALWSSLLAFAATLALQKIRSFDYWWHLHSGRFIAETGAVPRTDPFTFTAAGERWVDIYWLFQVALHALHRLGGDDAVILARLALVFALLAIVGRIGWRRDRPLVSVCALALMLIVACGRFLVRPELPTFVVLAAELAVLDRFARRGDAWVWAIVPLQVVWANFHGLFAVGIGLCGIHLAGEVARPLLGGGSLRRERVRRLAAVAALAALASLATPNLADTPAFALMQFGMIGQSDELRAFGAIIAEHRSPFDPRRQISDLDIGFGAALAALSLGAILLNFRRVRESDPLLWIAFLYLAASATRNRALFAIVATPILVRNLNDFLDARRLSLPRALGHAGAALASLALFALAVDVVRDRFFERFNSRREFGFGLLPLHYPVGAVDWIARERPPGPLCHPMMDGGYLMWRLHPDYPVMSDGRIEMLGLARVVELSLESVTDFQRIDARWRCGVVLLHHSLMDDLELLGWLRLNSNWKLTFADDVAAVFVRASGDASRRFAEVDVDDPDLFPPFEAARSPRDQQQRRDRAWFFMAMRRPEKALAIWEEATARYPELPDARRVHAGLLERTGALGEAEAIYASLIADEPRNADLRKRLGDVRLRLGDRDGARRLYDEALDIDPARLDARVERARVAEADGDVDLALRLYREVLASADAHSLEATLARARIGALTGRAPDLPPAR